MKEVDVDMWFGVFSYSCLIWIRCVRYRKEISLRITISFLWMYLGV